MLITEENFLRRFSFIYENEIYYFRRHVFWGTGKIYKGKERIYIGEIFHISEDRITVHTDQCFDPTSKSGRFFIRFREMIFRKYKKTHGSFDIKYAYKMKFKYE
jgi:hypothetical protein